MASIKDIENILSSRNLEDIDISRGYLGFPFPFSMYGIDIASEVISNAILESKKIIVVGDYDVDGVCSLSIVNVFFKKLGYENFEIKIPNRFKDGYGINVSMIGNSDIYISVDNGIVAFDVANKCHELNKTLIITDHHKPLIENGKENLPKAIIVNPAQSMCEFPQKEVCGAFVAFYVCWGVLNRLKEKLLENSANTLKINFNVEFSLDFLTPFVAIATIADIMPLVKFNRAIVKIGIANIANSMIPSIVFLRSRYNITSQNIAFSIAPLLNSAGRMADASLAFYFLNTGFDDVERKYNELVKLNKERKTIQNSVFEDSMDNYIYNEHFIVSYSEKFHEGVLGIVASKLVDKFNKSAFCFTLKDGILKGSGRASNNIDLIASIQRCDSILLRYGGHKGAAGLSLEKDNLDIFISMLNDHIVFTKEENSDDTDICVTLDILDDALYNLLERYEPYGYGNEALQLIAKNVAIYGTKSFGKSLEHQKLFIYQNNVGCEMLSFNSKHKSGIYADIKFTLTKENGTLKPIIIALQTF